MMSQQANSSITPGSAGGGNPLYLTPYLQDGRIEQAQNDSQVFIPNLDTSITLDSWSGYISVGANTSFHFFFWYFLSKGLKADRNTTDSYPPPLMVWLNGGPGISSMVGLFEEIGPLKANGDGTVSMRDVTWTDHFDVIFIDNPMDTGFSFSDSDGKINSVKEVADNLYGFIVQFFQLFPDTKSKDLYIGGQSFAGKYVPEFAGLVTKDKSINLKGIFVGAGLYDPSLMLPLYPDFLVTLGMLSDTKAAEMKYIIQQALDKHKINPAEAVKNVADYIFDESNTIASFGYENIENVLRTKMEEAWTVSSYLNQAQVQEAIHAKPTQFVHSNDKVMMDIASDFTQGVQDIFGFLLNSGIKVLVFNGQMDPIVSVAMTEKFLSSVSWNGSEEYQSADKIVWRDGKGMVAGYVTQVFNFTRVVIRKAGHRAAIDQPAWVMDMMKRFVYNFSFDELNDCGVC